MPTNRKPITRRRRGATITDAVIDLWRTCRAIEESDAVEAWEEDGGRRREYLDKKMALAQALGVRPWEVHPLDADDGWQGAPGTLYRESWPEAVALRRKIMAANGEVVQA